MIPLSNPTMFCGDKRTKANISAKFALLNGQFKTVMPSGMLDEQDKWQLYLYIKESEEFIIYTEA